VTRNLVAVVWYTLFAAGAVFAQHQVSAQLSLVGYLHNSENDTRLMDLDQYSMILGANAGYTYELAPAVAIGVQLTYLTGSVDHALLFASSPPAGPAPLTYSYAAARLREYDLDVAVCYRVNSWLEGRVGPSGGVIQRRITMETQGFEDLLSSRALGAHGGLNIRIRLSDDARYSVLASGMIRYLHAISFDEKGRALDNYSQNFTDGLLALGISYEFGGR